MALSGSKRDVPVTIGDTTYRLRYNFDAMTFIEDQTGKSFFDVLGTLTKMNMKNLGLIVFAGLRKNHPEIEQSEVGEIIDEVENLQAFIVAISGAITNYFARGNKAETKKNNVIETTPSSTVTAE